jgi:hypothetical protein
MNQGRQLLRVATRVAASVALLCAIGCATGGGRDLSGPLSSDPDVLAEQAAAGMGGRKAFDELRCLSWKFDGRRAYVWDRVTGRCRVDAHAANNLLTVQFNVQTREGIVYRNRTPVPPSEQAEWLERAYAWFINDSYWLLSAVKTLDPGTHRSYEGEQEFNGKMCPTFKLSFDEEVGLTPKDVYWFHIDPQTRRPAGWSFVLKGRDDPPTSYVWSEWQQVGQFILPVAFSQVGGDRVLRIQNLHATGIVEDAVFELP